MFGNPTFFFPYSRNFKVKRFAWPSPLPCTALSDSGVQSSFDFSFNLSWDKTRRWLLLTKVLYTRDPKYNSESNLNSSSLFFCQRNRVIFPKLKNLKCVCNLIGQQCRWFCRNWKVFYWNVISNGIFLNTKRLIRIKWKFNKGKQKLIS